MDKRKQKKIKRAAAMYKKPPAPCPNCGQPGAHFVPPSFGEEGFYACNSVDVLMKRVLDDPDFVVAGQDNITGPIA